MTDLLRIGAVTMLALAGAAVGEETPAGVDAAFEQLRQYDDGSPEEPLRTIERYVGRATGDAKAQREAAGRLAAILTDAKTSRAAKIFACVQLPLVASGEHVPLLVKLLSDPATAEPARRALAAIPGEASGMALREALGKLKGRALVGAINSLGARRDFKAVGALARLLGGEDGEVSAAAARALGEIGTADAAKALADAKVPAAGREAILDGQLRCAERMAYYGQTRAAGAIYRSVYATAKAVPQRVAALTGMVETAPAESEWAKTVLAALDSQSPAIRAAGLRLARELRGPEATKALVDRLGKANAPTRVVLIGILAEQGGEPAAKALEAQTADADEAVRLAAVQGLGVCGNRSNVSSLTKLAATETGAIRAAARRSLTRLQAPDVDPVLFDTAATGAPAERVEAIAALAARRAAGAEMRLTRLLADTDESVRVAAVDALGILGGPKSYAKLIDLLVSTTSPATTRALEKAALAVGARMVDPAGRAGPLVAAMKKAPAAGKASLLGLLGNSGTAEALAVVRGAIGDTETSVADAAVRALANWPDAAAAEDLLKLAGDRKNPLHQALALRGYLRLARSIEAGAARLKMLEAVGKIATTTAAKRQLLSALSQSADAGALGLAVGFVDDAEVRAEAAFAALAIGKALVATDRPAVTAAMETLQTKLTDADLLKQVKALHAQSLTKPPRRRGSGGGGGNSSAGLAPDKARSDAAKAQLAKAAPKGHRLACYLDCGPDDADGAKPGPVLRFAGGSKFSWSGADRIGGMQAATVHFSGQQVGYDLTGLDPKKTYQVGFTWWDYDHNNRTQSVWVSAGDSAQATKLLGPTKLPSYAAGKNKPGRETLPIPRQASGAGSCRITFRNEGGANVVVSEIWLWESQSDSAAPVAVQAQPGRRAPKKKPIRAKPAEKAKPPATEPYAFKPGKKGVKRVLIVTGVDIGSHKWQLTAPLLAAGLDADPRLAVDIVETPDFLLSKKLNDYDAVVLHFANSKVPDPGPVARENLKSFVAGGKGLVVVHFACGAFLGWDEFAKLAGRAWNPKLRGHDRRGPFTVNIVDSEHPVTAGMKAFETTDELYTCLDGDAKIHVLAEATSNVDKKQYPMAFVLNYGKGRVFNCPLGHDVKAFEAPGVLALFRRGTAWSVGLEPAAPATKAKSR